MTEFIAEILEKDFEEDDNDTSKWRTTVLKYFHKFGNIFSKKKSEWMLVRKLYDYNIDFKKDASLPQPAKLYSMSPKEHNFLDE